MIEQLQKILKSNNIHQNHKIVIAVSGGSDSMCLLLLFNKLGYENIMAAHCNFKLRGVESDSDEEFVKNYCNALNIRFISKSFNVSQYCEVQKVSIQVAARELRYQWFEELRKKNNYDYIATAHHLDDNNETVLMHLIRGCGIEGLTGIKFKTGKIIRPLISFSKVNLLDYLFLNNIPYREDSSNLKSDYDRNFIRNKLIPSITELNESFNNTFSNNISHWNDSYSIYKNHLEKIKQKLIDKSKSDIKLSVGKLLSYEASSTILFESIKEYGFNQHQVNDIMESILNPESKVFLSSNHRLIKEKKYLVITSLTSTSNYFLLEKKNQKVRTEFFEIEFEIIENSHRIKVESKGYQFLDADELEFPLIIRNWKQGDYFYPEGLNKKKKVSDYFTDKKTSLLEKERTLLLFSNDKLCSVVGSRIDNRFKVKPSTKSILRLSCNKLV
jgi:tRNA(Ile)-lysidine synthase